MDASTMGVIVQIHGHLQRRSRSLALRAPSTWPRRVLDICGLSGLIEPEPVDDAGMRELRAHP